MPIYQYNCSAHGDFDTYQSISERLKCKCPECDNVCDMVLATNDFQAKTNYILPPRASRKYGDQKPTSHRRARWT